MSMLFNSEILSKLLFHPLVKIDTLDDLVAFVSKHNHVKLISDQITSSWSIIKYWKNERTQFISPRLISVPLYKFNYEQVYNGESIIISFDNIFQHIMESNRDLSFHMSADRMFGSSNGLLYSKSIDSKAKRFIDSMMSSLFESGIYNHLEKRKFVKRLNIEEKDTPIAISISYFKKIVIIYAYDIVLLLFSLIVEILLFRFKSKQFVQTVTEEIIQLRRW